MSRISQFANKNRIAISLALIISIFLGVILIIRSKYKQAHDAGENSKEHISAVPGQSEEFFYNKAAHFLSVNSHLTLPLHIKKRGILSVSVSEINGHHIEFNLVRDGREIFHSGIQTGQASGRIEISPAHYTITIRNTNLVEAKNIQLTVAAQYQ